LIDTETPIAVLWSDAGSEVHKLPGFTTGIPDVGYVAWAYVLRLAQLLLSAACVRYELLSRLERCSRDNTDLNDNGHVGSCATRLITAGADQRRVGLRKSAIEVRACLEDSCDPSLRFPLGLGMGTFMVALAMSLSWVA